MFKLFINSFQNFLNGIFSQSNRCILKITISKLINNIYKIFNE